MKKRILTKLIVFAFAVFVFPSLAGASFVGERATFFVDSSYSKTNQTSINATLKNSSDLLDIYIEDNWWNNITEEEKREAIDNLNSLSQEFSSRMFNQLTYSYGSVWDTGVSTTNKKITILFHQLRDDAKGYTRNIDMYEKAVAPYSNQKEMVYLNTGDINDELLKSYLAHEFSHLIQINQKEKKLGNPEETWLNELRAEYAPTLMGYNNASDKDNYLRKRVTTFLTNSTRSLTQWGNNIYNYGTVSMFGHYLVDHYGVEILTESLKNSNKVGIESIEEILKKRGYTESFEEIFNNWTIANYVNNCSANDKYCYKNENLTGLQIIPFSNFVPFAGESTLVIGQSLPNWSSHWQRFSGANKDLKLVFDGKYQEQIKVHYILRYYNGKQEIKELVLDKNKTKEIVFPKMGTDIASLIVVVSAQDKSISFQENKSFNYSISVSTINSVEEEPQEQEIKLPFAIDKPLNQMNREELLMVIIRTIIYLLVQGKLVI